MKSYIVAGLCISLLSACGEAPLSEEARQYIIQNATASAEGLSDRMRGNEAAFQVLSAEITDVGRDGVCGFVETSKDPIPFVAMSKEVDAIVMMGPGPRMQASYFQSTLDDTRERHLKLITEQAEKAGCSLEQNQ